MNENLSATITGVTPSASTSGTLRFGANINSTAVIYFGNEQWSACNNYTLDEGRDLLELDMEERSRVCVIGSYLADTLFGFQDPIGQTLSVNGTPPDGGGGVLPEGTAEPRRAWTTRWWCPTP